MFKIGDFSKLAQVSVKTLHHYDHLNLLEPAWVDRFTGYRYYSLEQLPRLNRILALKVLGFSLAQIQDLLLQDLPPTKLRLMMRNQQLEMERQVQQETARLRRIETRIRQIDREGSFPAYDVVLKQTPPLKVVGLRGFVSEMNDMLELFAELNRDLPSRLLDSPILGPHLAVYYDTEYRDQHIDLEAARLIKTNSDLGLDLLMHDLPPVSSMASTIYQGRLADLPDATHNLLAWVSANGYRISGPAREVYLQSALPADFSDDLIVEVQVPVEIRPKPIFIPNPEEKIEMEPKFVSKPAFTAVGLEYYGTNQHQEIAELWHQFNPRIREIVKCIDGAFGLCGPMDERGAFRYLAAMEVSDPSPLPDGMTVWEVPAQDYIAFPCTLPHVGETYQYAFESWIPQSSYVYTQGVDFELYDEKFDPQDPNSPMFVYIPVEKKRS